MSSHLVRAGESSTDSYTLQITPESAGWQYCGLRVATLSPGGSVTFCLEDSEAVVLSLSGGAQVACDGRTFTLAGRRDVFSGPSDQVYVPRGAEATLTSIDGGRFAIASARCEAVLPARHMEASEIPVELRGAGQASRQVNNFGVPGVLDADRLIACEVLTPGGNWSSYPPHKHDEERDGETELEEIYYFEVAPGPTGPGIAYQRVYGHESAEIDVLEEIRDGDAITIPHGWHGPSMAVPGYDLYYLNVMAGPGSERAWLICDDPAHAWIRDTWAEQPVDSRLPFSGGRP
ncbi:5-deoxy-glucuronate isomerase [Aeromicrobium sp. CF3.5]|uniref:5-deoxy-glucuronate isomerase n=1 Tax=Aeromicrobium sp. CF3.5 TaxID=3373078 RepID=UPI003EE6F687